MNREEKILTAIDVIGNEYKRIVKGNTVTISSDVFGDKGLTFDDQQQALDFLANDKKWIKCTSEYYSGIKVETIVDRLKPDLIRLVPPVRKVVKKPEESFVYTIEILDSYSDKFLRNNEIQNSELAPTNLKGTKQLVGIKLAYDPDSSQIQDKSSKLRPLKVTSKQQRFLMTKLWSAKQHRVNIKDLDEGFSRIEAENPSKHSPIVGYAGAFPFKSSSNKLKNNIKKHFGVEEAIYYERTTNEYKLNKQHF